MRKTACLILVLLFFISGCTLQNTNPESTATPAVSLFDAISLGITPEQLLTYLSEANIPIELPDYTDFPLPEDVPDAVKDGRTYNMSDLSFYYQAEGIRLLFTFNYDSRLSSISCRDKEIATPKGLAVGDSLDTAKQIYGNEFVENPEDLNALQYHCEQGYLNIFYEENIVTGWSLNSYQNITND